MSDTLPEPPDPPPGNGDSLQSPTFVIAVLLILVAAGTIAGLFWRGSPEVIASLSGMVVGGIIGAVTGYFFGASKHAAPTQGPTP
jgi:ABC-type xylose transport system permease subunit